MDYEWKFKVLCVIFALIPAISAGGMQIFGGSQVQIAQFGYQLQFVIKGQTICGASLISNSWAITVAHCTADFKKGIILMGGSNVRGNGVVIPVLKVIQHAAYNPKTFVNDISLLNFAPVTISNILYPIKLPSFQQQVASNTNCTISGYGLTQSNQFPTVLLGTNITVSDQISCAKNYSQANFVVTQNMICAGSSNGQEDSCSGDSGGPMVCNGFLIGAVSIGFGCGVAKFPGVYTKISMYRQWIASNTGI